MTIRDIAPGLLAAALLALAACGQTGEGEWGGGADAGASGEPCSGHGSQHGEHCHCEGGWASYQGTCLAIASLPACAAGSPAHASCRCETASEDCPCPEETDTAYYVGAYYCEEPLH